MFSAKKCCIQQQWRHANHEQKEQKKFTEFRNSDTWDKIGEFLEGIKQQGIAEPNLVSEIARFKKLIEFLKAQLAIIDSDLIPIDLWDNLNAQLNSCCKRLSSDLNGLQNANNTLDQILKTINPYITPYPPSKKNLHKRLEKH